MRTAAPLLARAALAGGLALLCGGGVGCNGTAPAPATPAAPEKKDPPAMPPPPPPTSEAGVEPGTPGTLSPPQGRARRRMNIDQLDAAIRRATSGLGWDVNGQNQFTRLAPSLGKPDYLQRTREVLEPSLIFQKFLDDAARSVCARLVAEERNRAADDRVLFVKVPAGRADPSGVTPEAVDENLRAVLLRFHGRKLEPGAPELSGWRFLYQSAVTVSGNAETAWQTVCVGVMTHPDFYTY